MKNRMSISVILALMMIASTFVVAGNINNSSDNGRGLVVEKNVFNATSSSWESCIKANIGDNVRFNISITYYPVDVLPPEDDGDGMGYKAKDLVVNDTLPDCLEYNDSLLIKHGDNENTTDIHEEIDDSIIWYLTRDYGIELFDNNPGFPKTVYLEFNATVIDDGENINHVNVTGFEKCGNEDLWDEAEATVNVPEEGNPEITIDKKVKDPESDEWIEGPLTAYYEELDPSGQLEFMINVSNTGNVDLNNPVVTDILPDFLEFHHQSTIPPGLSFSQDGKKLTWTWIDQRVEEEDIFLYIWVNVTGDFDELKTGRNYVNVTVDEDAYDEDFVDITLRSHFIFKKEVYNGSAWTDNLDLVKKGTPVKFRLTGTYYGDIWMHCLVIGDDLPDCLEYADNEKIWIAGEEITETHDLWPDIYVGEDTIEVCGDEYPIPEGSILWDWSNKPLSIYDGDSVIIEFETQVTEYCDDCEYPECCVDQNCAFGHIWSCYECKEYHGEDCVNITCCPPPKKFTKKVSSDRENWKDSIETIKGNTISFKLEHEYYGEVNLTDVKFEDKLPCILEYADNVDITVIGGNGVSNVDPEISTDGKTLWWNLTYVNLTDGGKIIIIFDAEVVGTTGTCEECQSECLNKAWVTGIYRYCGGDPIIIEGYPMYDDVDITSECNCPPSIPQREGDTSGEPDETLSFNIFSTDSDGDQVKYTIDWDGETQQTSYFEEGVEISLTHSWNSEGTYEVIVKATDEHGLESDWSYPLVVTISEGEEPPEEEGLEIIAPGSFNFKTVSANVKNTGDTSLNDVNWNFTIYKQGLLGKIRWQALNNGTIDLDAGKAKSISSGQVNLYRFGLANIEIKAKCGELEDSLTKKAFVVAGLIIIW